MKAVTEFEMRIRQHRELLEDSMKTVEEIQPTISAIRKYFKKNSLMQDTYNGKIVVKHYGFDERINWDTHIITIDGNAIGFTDELVEQDRN